MVSDRTAGETWETISLYLHFHANADEFCFSKFSIPVWVLLCGIVIITTVVITVVRTRRKKEIRISKSFIVVDCLYFCVCKIIVGVFARGSVGTEISKYLYWLRTKHDRLQPALGNIHPFCLNSFQQLFLPNQAAAVSVNGVEEVR